MRKFLGLILLVGFVSLCAEEDESGLRILRGRVENFGKVSGAGFTSIDAQDYNCDVRFDTPFSDNPAITVSTSYPDGQTVPGCVFFLPGESTFNKGFRTHLYNPMNRKYLGAYFSFIAIGK